MTMFEFQKLCRKIEEMDPRDKAVCLHANAAAVIGRLRALNIEDFDPVEVLAAFIVGSVVSDGSISEKDLLKISPSLSESFGDACDLEKIKYSFSVSKDVQKAIAQDTQELISVLALVDEDLACDIITLCLLVTSVDGKISPKEQRYVKQLIKA